MTAATARTGPHPTSNANPSRAAAASARPRGASPGNSIPRPTVSPAAPAIRIAGISSTPWGATNPQKSALMPRAAVSCVTAPSRTPFINRIHTVPMPAVIPIANAAIATLRLLENRNDDAAGLIVTRSPVHISPRSMDASRSGGAISPANPGSRG